MAASLEGLSSLGPVTAARLREIGINDPGQLRAVGAIEAYRQLKFRFGRHITLNALYGLDAAIRDVHWRTIDARAKAKLRQQAGID